MNVIIKSSSGITLVPIESRLLSERKIFLEGEIDSNKACDFIKELIHLCKDDSTKPIDLLINSPGGDISSGLLIYDSIQSCKTPIRTYCMGNAYSMGALLFASGNHGRFMFPHSELMLHEPILGNRVGGSASSIRSISDSLLETRDRMNKILARHTGKTEEQIAEATSYDHYYGPQESIDFGLADEVISLSRLMEG